MAMQPTEEELLVEEMLSPVLRDYEKDPVSVIPGKGVGGDLPGAFNSYFEELVNDMVKDSEFQGPQRQVVAVGGLGSTTNDNFFKEVLKIAPGAVLMPLRGTGHGLAGVGIGNASDQIRDEMNKYETNKIPALFVGHSLGASLLHNQIQKIPSRSNIRTILVDAPYDPPWQQSPFQPPTARAITSASESGIKYAPNTLPWTGGKAIMYGPNPAHTPWNNTNYPGNMERLEQMRGLIRRNMSYGPLPISPP